MPLGWVEGWQLTQSGSPDLGWCQMTAFSLVQPTTPASPSGVQRSIFYYLCLSSSDAKSYTGHLAVSKCASFPPLPRLVPNVRPFSMLFLGL